MPRHAASARKPTANIGGMEVCAADFMPRTPLSPKHSSPAGAELSEHCLSICASVDLVHVLYILTHKPLHVFKRPPLLLHGAAALESGKLTLNKQELVAHRALHSSLLVISLVMS